MINTPRIVILINPSPSATVTRSIPKPLPLALLSLASTLIPRYKVILLDRSVDKSDERLQELTGQEGVVAVGISVLTGPVIRDAIHCAKLVKKLSPGVAVIWGGWHCTKAPETVLAEDYADYIIQGEGEHSLPLLLERLFSAAPRIDNLAGVGWKTEEGIRINPPGTPLEIATLPPLPLELIKDIEPYIIHNWIPGGGRCLPLETSRGCPNFCTFCDISYYFGAKYNARTPEQMIEQISEMRKRWNIGGVRFFDPNFFLQIRRVREFANRLIDSGLNITWGADGTIVQFRNVSADDLDLFVKSGLRFISFGVESGNERIRYEVLNKKFTDAQCMLVIERLLKAGIQFKFNIMLGLPGESEGETLASARFASEIVSQYPNSAGGRMYVFMPFPGTPLTEKAKQLGFVLPQNLEQYAATSFFGSHTMPWLSPRQSRMVRVMALMSYFLSSNRESIPHRGLLRLISLLARKFYLIRMRHGWFANTPDIWLLERILE